MFLSPVPWTFVWCIPDDKFSNQARFIKCILKIFNSLKPILERERRVREKRERRERQPKPNPERQRREGWNIGLYIMYSPWQEVVKISKPNTIYWIHTFDLDNIMHFFTIQIEFYDSAMVLYLPEVSAKQKLSRLA